MIGIDGTENNYSPPNNGSHDRLGVPADEAAVRDRIAYRLLRLADVVTTTDRPVWEAEMFPVHPEDFESS